MTHEPIRERGPVDPAQEVEVVADAIDDVVPPDEGAARGVRALAGESFSLAETIGGVRGLVESMAPGLVFVVVFIATGNTLQPALVASVAVALVAVAARLVQRTPVTQAFGGFLGVAIGVLWAWRSGEAQNYYAAGLLTNAAYLVVMAVSVLVRWPVVGLVVEALRSGWTDGDKVKPAVASSDVPDGATTSGARVAPGQRVESTVGDVGGSDGDQGAPVPGAFRAWADRWRGDAVLMRRYALATWLWVGMFALRLAVQVPLFMAGEDAVAWLGTARLVMGIPLWALTLWLTWLLVRRPHGAQAVPEKG
ncbi:DUF3159 domain-containing protein [Oerskovia turbata]|uniref:DUF3159 domain-containing protein n=1 Tax=Oerskovia turbata TaxID=1713 RepID=A0A4Q1KPK7_9CELL|nr:DUF3159 domain-containing protein [Oerskovia turbata]RXR23181.1 DUF3159 domain-containing protein [Oerskovia turbata]RXR31921.1 DUF3159 domain-containing protein [Oerskovia turbata]TGJ97153.1 DUF3159 domain-containing protein [Actinotalea fermentans ATCC 43279 = JCM 9966 = DSM 3133]